ncbi:hypothetical protein AKJ16_DCAP15459 [Drosera capensis]
MTTTLWPATSNVKAKSLFVSGKKVSKQIDRLATRRWGTLGDRGDDAWGRRMELRQNNTVSVSSILGGASDNTGSSMARRLVLRTGLNVILACNISKNNPMIQAGAEKKLMEKLINPGYTKPRLTSK